MKKYHTNRLELLIIACLVFFSASVLAADYAREKRWANEVVPDLLDGKAIYLKQKNGHSFLSLYMSGEKSKPAILILHGMGIHPNWGLIGTMRVNFAEKGYATFSIQLPVLASDAKMQAYRKTQPEAAERTRIAVQHLKKLGYKKIILLSHSMGSRTAHRYFDKNKKPAVVAWVSLGNHVKSGFSGINIPVLDVFGDHDEKSVLKNAVARQQTLKGNKKSRQVKIKGSDHFYNNKMNELQAAILSFLKQF